MSESTVGSFNPSTPAPSAAAHGRMQVERDELQAKLDELMVRGDEMTGPGDAVDHAVSISRQVEVEHIQGQINQLDMLLSLPPRAEADLPDGVVAVGSTVRIAFPGGDEQTLLLATIEEAQDAGEVLTFDSPLGKALLGKRADDEVEYAAPGGSMKVRILDVGNGAGR